MIPRLASFSVKYPTIELDIVALDRLADFNTEQFDGHIHFGSGDYFGLKALWLANETVYPIYHPALIDDHQTQDLSSLIQHHQLLFYKAGIEDEPGGISWHDWLNHYNIERPSQLNKMSFSHVALAITAAKKQLGIALGWHHLVIDDVNQGQLISLDKFAMTTPFSYYLVAPSCAWENSNFRLFANWLTKQMT
ncbi:hypothetical protein CW748_02865 [Alteromonadales bacterium alter-6D02]|nr:hypothetical protein CW748_02865 [Alteromonadales bacterium alter-6D02]